MIAELGYWVNMYALKSVKRVALVVQRADSEQVLHCLDEQGGVCQLDTKGLYSFGKAFDRYRLAQARLGKPLRSSTDIEGLQVFGRLYAVRGPWDWTFLPAQQDTTYVQVIS